MAIQSSDVMMGLVFPLSGAVITMTIVATTAMSMTVRTFYPAVEGSEIGRIPKEI